MSGPVVWTRVCEHKWVFQGVIYWSGATRPGSGARDRHYGDRFFCEKCLEQKVINDRIEGNDYSKALEGAMPR